MEIIDKNKYENKATQHINYMYICFLTGSGKGYGCFAARKLETDQYEVAGSFCSPNDNFKFNKTIARRIALGRLKSGNNTVIVDSLSNNSMTEIVEQAINKDILILPNWAEKAYINGLYIYTLKYDCKDIKSIILEDESKEFAAAFVKAYCFLPWR